MGRRRRVNAVTKAGAGASTQRRRHRSGGAVQRDGGQGQAGDAVATESEGKGKQTPPLRRKWGLGYEKPLSCAWSERGKWRHELTASCHGKKRTPSGSLLGRGRGMEPHSLAFGARVRMGTREISTLASNAGWHEWPRHKSHDVVCGGTKATQNGRRYVRA